MTREKLREIVCALQAMPGDIGGGVFNWTLPIRQLFARAKNGGSINARDLIELGRACEIAAGIARILHGRNLEPWFDDCRTVIAHDHPGCAYEDTLRHLRKKRGDAEREYLKAFEGDA